MLCFLCEALDVLLRGRMRTWLVLLTVTALFALLLAPAWCAAFHAPVATLSPPGVLLAARVVGGLVCAALTPRLLAPVIAVGASRAPPA